MASFNGSYLVFNNTSSEQFGLRIINFDNGVTDSSLGSEPTIFNKWMINRSKAYFYGRSLNTPLTFEITLGAEEPIDAIQRGNIGKWLIGKSNYLPLYIDQPDLFEVVYNVIVKHISPKYIGNECRALAVLFEADSSFGYSYPKTWTKTYSSASTLATYNYLCMSDSDEYLYPNLTFKTSGTSGGSACNFSITNHTDASRIFSFTGISGSETIIVNNDLGIISSDTGLLRMSKFNKNFLRFIPGNNVLTVSGCVVSVSITASEARGVGG